MSIQAALMIASASVVFLLGSAHLVLTFIGSKLHPREHECRQAMESTAPVLTRQTTIWRAWIGFNASHSFGAMLFGVLYGYFAVAQPKVLFGSPFLLAIGALFLLGYVVLGRLYWFSTPFRGILLSAALYVAALLFSASET